jgi:hypothetical protein
MGGGGAGGKGLGGEGGVGGDGACEIAYFAIPEQVVAPIGLQDWRSV